jgi:hypothetical protein
MMAVKVLAWVQDDGFPMVVPALSLQPVGDRRMVCRLDPELGEPPSGARVAVNILTFDVIPHQATGRWTRTGNGGELLVEEVYAGGPPIPGGRVA